MKRIIKISLAAALVLCLALSLAPIFSNAFALGIANGNGFRIPNFAFNWIIPGGAPEGVSMRELYLENPFEFNFDGQTYAPPTDWQTFAGAALKLSFKGQLEEPLKICFHYPKALYSGTWHGQIHRLTGGQWLGFPTTQEYHTISIPVMYAAFAFVVPENFEIQLPFLCTHTSIPGIYIVVDYWTP